MKIKIRTIFLIIYSIVLYPGIILAVPNVVAYTNQNSTDLPYVILTNFSEASPYYSSVNKLKDYRNATIVQFSGDVFSVSDVLKGIQPKYVAIMVSPTDIDEGFAFKIFSLAKQMDSNFDTDFSYGFITGNSPTDIENYIDNVINYENSINEMPKVFRCFYRTGTGSVGGSDETSQFMIDAYSNLGVESQRINTDIIDHELVLNNITNAGIIHLFEHGTVTMVECLNYNEIPTFDHPVMVINNGCHGGSISKWYNQSIPSPPSNNYEDRSAIINPEFSLALNFLKKGALAYYGHMCMWGNGTWHETLTSTLSNDVTKSTGELLLTWYNKPSQPDIITDTVGSMPNDLYGIDNNRFTYSAVILYGDPALKFKILAPPPSKPILLTPINNATNIVINPTLTWNSSSGATSYRLQVSLNSEFLTTVIDQSNISETLHFISTDLSNNASYYWRVNATNTSGTSDWSDQWKFTTTTPNIPPIVFNPNLTYGTVSDIDGNTYKTIQIGNQIWMAENLRTKKYSDGTPLIDGIGLGDISSDYITKYYFSYNDDPNYAYTFGYLYTWAAVMNGEASSNTNPSGVRGVCPTGWHVPSIAEWNELESYLDYNDAGGKLKEVGTDHWLSPNTGATNETGFTALPGGYKAYNGVFFGLYERTFLWMSCCEGAFATDLIRYDVSGLSSTGDSRVFGHSVRCVQDNDVTKINVVSTSLIRIFPNPNTGVLSIEYNDDNAEFSTLKIFDSQGRSLVKEKVVLPRQQIDFSKYSSGLYILEFIKSSGESTQVKILKN